MEEVKVQEINLKIKHALTLSLEKFWDMEKQIMKKED